MTTYYNNNVNQIKKGFFLMFYSHLQSFAIGIIISSITFVMFLHHKESEAQIKKTNEMIKYTKDVCINQRPKNTETKLCEFLKKKYL